MEINIENLGVGSDTYKPLWEITETEWFLWQNAIYMKTNTVSLQDNYTICFQLTEKPGRLVPITNKVMVTPIKSQNINLKI